MQKEYPKQDYLVSLVNNTIEFAIQITLEDDLAVAPYVDRNATGSSPSYTWKQIPASENLFTRTYTFKAPGESEVGFVITEWGEDLNAPTGRDVSLNELVDPLDWSEIFRWTVEVTTEEELRNISKEELFTYGTGTITLTGTAYELYMKANEMKSDQEETDDPDIKRLDEFGE